MIDTHCVALSATLSSKDALASRLYVRLAIAGQTLAWAAVLYADISYVASGDARSQDCLGPQWFDSKIAPGTQDKYFPFRAFWISHSYDLIQSSVLAICHTERFDKLEKINRKQQDTVDDQDRNRTGYSRLPSTAFSNWVGFALHPIFLIIFVERHLSRNKVDVGGIREWGQSFTIIACTCALVHWVYVNLPLLKLPFTCLWRSSWISHRGPVLPTNVMRLIAIGAPSSLIGEENYDLLSLRTSRRGNSPPDNFTSLSTLPQHASQVQSFRLPTHYNDHPISGPRADQNT